MDLKAAFLLVAVAVIGVALWFSGALNSSARHLLIDQVMAHPAADGTVAAVLTIDNQGLPDWLLSVRSPTADAMLHGDGTAEGLPIQTGTSSLAMDAAHIRITPPATGFEEGALLPLTLTFAKAGEISIKARFSTPAQKGGGHMGMSGHGVMHQVSAGEAAPALTLTVQPVGDGWQAQIVATDFTFSEEQQGLDHVPGTGHGHIYLGGMKLGRVFGAQYDIGPLPKGRHEVRVTLNTNDHRVYMVAGEDVTASAVIVVD